MTTLLKYLLKYLPSNISQQMKKKLFMSEKVAVAEKKYLDFQTKMNDARPLDEMAFGFTTLVFLPLGVCMKWWFGIKP